MRILIAEEALQVLSGHWPCYIGGIAGHCRAVGDRVDVLTHRDAVPEVLDKVGGLPVYTYNSWRHGGKSRRAIAAVHCYRFFSETRSYMRSEGPFDVVLVPTMRLHHLVAFSLMFLRPSGPITTRFIMFFVQGFGRYVAPGEPTVFPAGFSTRLARFAFGRMAEAVRSGRVVLAGETAGMVDELTRFTGLPATLFPHPVHLPGASTLLSERATGGPERVLTVTCPGHARHEKGSDLLHDAILRILGGPLGERLRFVMQWPEPFGMPDGGTMEPDPRLLADPRVEFLNGTLDPGQYSALLERSDLVILPYRSHSYHQRLSRVAIEAAGKGIPLIYTAHTWIQEVADFVGSGVRIETEDVAGVVSAIEQAQANVDELRAAAKHRAAAILNFHSAATFRDLLK